MKNKKEDPSNVIDNNLSIYPNSTKMINNNNDNFSYSFNMNNNNILNSNNNNTFQVDLFGLVNNNISS